MNYYRLFMNFIWAIATCVASWGVVYLISGWEYRVLDLLFFPTQIALFTWFYYHKESQNA